MFSRLKIILKSLLAGAFYFGGIFRFLKFINNASGRRLTILAYHRVTNKDICNIKASLPSLFVTRDSFIKQLEFIKRHYTIINFKELKTHVSKNDIPPNSLIITFDDGYEDNYQNAYPIMQSINVPAVMFLTVNKISRADRMPYWWDRMYCYLSYYKQWYVEGLYPEHDAEIQVLLRQFRENPSHLFSYYNQEDTDKIDNLLNSLQSKYKISDDLLNGENTILQWEQVQKMSENIEFGSHTCSHHNLVHLKQDQLHDEIGASFKILKARTKYAGDALSYPAGNYDDALKRKVAEAGYDFAVTLEAGINDLKDKYALKRICSWEGTSRGINGKFSKSMFAYKLIGF